MSETLTFEAVTPSEVDINRDVREAKAAILRGIDPSEIIYALGLLYGEDYATEVDLELKKSEAN